MNYAEADKAVSSCLENGPFIEDLIEGILNALRSGTYIEKKWYKDEKCFRETLVLQGVHLSFHRVAPCTGTNQCFPFHAVPRTLC